MVKFRNHMRYYLVDSITTLGYTINKVPGDWNCCLLEISYLFLTRITAKLSDTSNETRQGCIRPMEVGIRRMGKVYNA